MSINGYADTLTTSDSNGIASAEAYYDKDVQDFDEYVSDEELALDVEMDVEIVEIVEDNSTEDNTQIQPSQTEYNYGDGGITENPKTGRVKTSTIATLLGVSGLCVCYLIQRKK